MTRVAFLAGLASLAMAGGALAQTAPTVQVVLGPAVQARVNQLGRSELDAQRQSLARAVTAALASGGLKARNVNLVIQDIQPNRPTSAELGASPGLRANSYGLGDAAITGEVVMDDGAVRPVRYRFAPPDIYAATNFDTWGDAQEAFAGLAGDLRKGVVPYQTAYWPPPHKATAPTGSLIAQ